MANAVLDARQEGDSYRRIEVITGQSRRRRWTAEEKARIVAESFETDTNISEVARRNGVARGLLTAWRHQFAATARSKAASFVPVRIVEESGGGTTGEPDHAAPAQLCSQRTLNGDQKEEGALFDLPPAVTGGDHQETAGRCRG